MADLLTRQGARNLTRTIDRVANAVQHHAEALGLPAEVALDYAKRSDLISDAIELTAVNNFPINAAEVDQTPAADADPEVQGVTDESGGVTDEDPDSDDQNKPEAYYEGGSAKVAKPEFEQPARNETGDSVEPAGSAAPHWDANAIGDDRGGPYLDEPDEPYMAGHFAQNWFHQLRDKQQAGQIPGVDKFASRVMMAAAMTDIMRVARLGGLTDAEIKQYIHDLTEMDKQLAELTAEIAKVAGDLMAKKDQLSADPQQQRSAFGDKLPETVKGQGKMVVEIRDTLLEYTKVAAEKPPAEATLREGVLAEAEARFGAELRDALDDIWDAVRKENVGLKKAVAKVSYSLKSASADKEAGVMDWLASISEFFGKVLGALARLFDMATSAISGANKRVSKAFADYQKAHKAALKSASVESDDQLLRRLLAEEKMDKKSDDDEDEDDEDDEGEDTEDEGGSEDEDAEDEPEDEGDKESGKKKANDFGFNLFK